MTDDKTTVKILELKSVTVLVVLKAFSVAFVNNAKVKIFPFSLVHVEHNMRGGKMHRATPLLDGSQMYQL